MDYRTFVDSLASNELRQMLGAWRQSSRKPQVDEVKALSAYFLRRGCRDGSVPCVLSGKTYYINIPALLKKLGATENRKEN